MNTIRSLNLLYVKLLMQLNSFTLNDKHEIDPIYIINKLNN